MAKSIDISELDIYYHDFKAVEGVTMSIPAKSVTALIGPSGCGKSTFLRSINRMHEVIPGARVQGTISVDGQNLYSSGVDPVDVRRQIGMVFQRPNPFPTMSIYANVLAGIRLNSKRVNKQTSDEIVERALRSANLWNEVKDRLGRPGAGPSGGGTRGGGGGRRGGPRPPGVARGPGCGGTGAAPRVGAPRSPPPPSRAAD